MFNKNGQKLLNANYGEVTSGSGTNTTGRITLMGVNANNPLKDVSGNSLAVAYQFYNSSGLSGDYLIQAVTKFTLIGFHGVYASGSITATTATKDRGVRYHVGYRNGGFNEDVIAPVDTANSYVSFSQSYGVKTFTVANSSNAPITINEISFSCYIAGGQDASAYREILFAGFNLGEITIPAGGAYSFTLTHLMES